METPYLSTVLVHKYGRRNQQKHLEFTFSIKALSFHSRASIRAHKHPPGGKTPHMKGVGMLVVNFELNP